MDDLHVSPQLLNFVLAQKIIAFVTQFASYSTLYTQHNHLSNFSPLISPTLNKIFQSFYLYRHLFQSILHVIACLISNSIIYFVASLWFCYLLAYHHLKLQNKQLLDRLKLTFHSQCLQIKHFHTAIDQTNKENLQYVWYALLKCAVMRLSLTHILSLQILDSHIHSSVH